MNLQGLKILIVDDSNSLLLVLEHYLKELGATEIIKVNDGEAALYELKECSGKLFDLVISDWVMPKMNGIDLLKSMRSDFDFMHTPFLMIAGEDDPAEFNRAKGIGPTEIVLKPFDAQKLADKLKMILTF